MWCKLSTIIKLLSYFDGIPTVELFGKFKDKPCQHRLKVNRKPDRVYRLGQVLDLVNNHLTMSVDVPI